MKKLLAVCFAFLFGAGVWATEVDFTGNYIFRPYGQYKIDGDKYTTLSKLGTGFDLAVLFGQWDFFNAGINLGFGFDAPDFLLKNGKKFKTAQGHSYDGASVFGFIGPAFRYNLNNQMAIIGTFGFAGEMINYDADLEYDEDSYDFKMNGYVVKVDYRYYISEAFGYNIGLQCNIFDDTAMDIGDKTYEADSAFDILVRLGITWRLGTGL